ncbi:hypothetical protein CHL67_09980 [Prosthecochloris sp. GSB1]|uniref:DUF1848 domain-containing protein n=1 Tax=Prosthecochloris sp. GSB1 TaxID=281093 RepID=UPI000B8CB378|nr:DUF1848 domain-containing protein [Prosthecochloris sp. GSB1]ASQ91196.1 hypothetical protein CHL67_09980 [Prosthecochloris sp. GSB1]
MLFGNDKQVISASRRTDIPAFHADWLIDRVRHGYCKVANPCNPSQVRKVSLHSADVAAIVFWTRRAKPLLRYLDELDDRGFNYYFLYTITGCPAGMEPGLPDKQRCVEDFLELSARTGPEKVLWRYDPVIMSKDLDHDHHVENFSRLAEQLAAGTNSVIITFLKRYPHIEGSMRKAGVFEPARLERELLAKAIGDVAAKRGLTVRGCGGRESFPGLEVSKCIDEKLLGRLFGLELSSAKDKGQPAECRCIRSIDIGAYGSCLHGCVYCYASRNFARARLRYGRNVRGRDML